MNQPLFFYKFVPFERKDILKNGLIRFTPAKDFNDPFEIQPTITPCTLNWIEYVVNLSAEERENLEFNKSDYLYSHERVELLPEKRSLLNEKINKIGILSLSSNLNINQLLTVSVPDKKDPRTNILMWSHYADHHRGFVIEFKQDFIQGIDIQKLEYSKERDIITYEDIDDKNFYKLFFKKSTEWFYEQEYRAILELDKADKIIDNIIHLFKFDKTQVNSITFGCNMSKDNKKEIMDLIKKDSVYKNVQFNHAYLNDDGYYLNFYHDDGRFTNRLEYNGQALVPQTISIQKDLNANKI